MIDKVKILTTANRWLSVLPAVGFLYYFLPLDIPLWVEWGLVITGVVLTLTVLVSNFIVVDTPYPQRSKIFFRSLLQLAWFGALIFLTWIAQTMFDGKFTIDFRYLLK